MNGLTLPINWNGRIMEANLDEGYCISIPLDHTAAQPNAYSAPLYEASPVVFGDWIGDTRQGASVNFYNVRLNPHGNGTHTECVGHISLERHSVNRALGNGRWIAQLISAYPVVQENGDRVIEELEWQPGVEAIIIRTMPNHPDKMIRHY